MHWWTDKWPQNAAFSKDFDRHNIYFYSQAIPQSVRISRETQESRKSRKNSGETQVLSTSVSSLSIKVEPLGNPHNEGRRVSAHSYVNSLWKKWKHVFSYPTDVLEIALGVWVSFSSFNMQPTQKHTRTGLFIPKGAKLKEREPLNHVPVPHPRYQPRLMSSPLMKKKKKTRGAKERGPESKRSPGALTSSSKVDVIAVTSHFC